MANRGSCDYWGERQDRKKGLGRACLAPANSGMWSPAPSSSIPWQPSHNARVAWRSGAFLWGSGPSRGLLTVLRSVPTPIRCSARWLKMIGQGVEVDKAAFDDKRIRRPQTSHDDDRHQHRRQRSYAKGGSGQDGCCDGHLVDRRERLCALAGAAVLHGAGCWTSSSYV